MIGPNPLTKYCRSIQISANDHLRVEAWLTSIKTGTCTQIQLGRLVPANDDVTWDCEAMLERVCVGIEPCPFESPAPLEVPANRCEAIWPMQRVEACISSVSRHNDRLEARLTLRPKIDIHVRPMTVLCTDLASHQQFLVIPSMLARFPGVHRIMRTLGKFIVITVHPMRVLRFPG